jgi:hypothetical protein
VTPSAKAVLDLPGERAVGHARGGKGAAALDFDRTGVLGTVAPLGDVQVMNTPVADEPDAVIGDVIPGAVIARPRLVGPVRVGPDPLEAVRLHGRRAEPQLVIQLRRHGLGGLIRERDAPGHADQDGLEPADLWLRTNSQANRKLPPERCWVPN